MNKFTFFCACLCFCFFISCDDENPESNPEYEDMIELPTVSISDVSLPEGNDNTVFKFTVNTSKEFTEEVSVDFSTVEITAEKGTDFIDQSGTLIIPVGEVEGSIEIQIVTNQVLEADEEFKVVLSNPANANISKGEGLATILNDDETPCIMDFAKLTNCSEKSWKLLPAEGALKVGPSLEEVGYWWQNTAEDVIINDCHFNDVYIFRNNGDEFNVGEYEFQNNGDFWVSFGFEQSGLDDEACYPSSSWPEAFEAWDSGIHNFSVMNGNLTVTGEGAWIGLYKIGSLSEVTEPQQSVTYNIYSITEEELLLVADYGSLVWQLTLVPAE